MEAVAEADLEVDDSKFSYVEALALCKECGDELYVPDINDRNVQSREAAYRKAVSYFDEWTWSEYPAQPAAVDVVLCHPHKGAGLTLQKM